MKKWILILLVFITGYASAQPTNYLYRKTRERAIAYMADSTFSIPVYNGTPSGLRTGSPATAGHLAMDTANNILYLYTGGGWVRAGNGDSTTLIFNIGTDADTLLVYYPGSGTEDSIGIKSVTVGATDPVQVTTVRNDSLNTHTVYIRQTFLDSIRNGDFGGGTWGSITGTLSSQTDLQAALDAKVNISDTAAMLSGYARVQRLLDSMSAINSRAYCYLYLVSSTEVAYVTCDGSREDTVSYTGGETYVDSIYRKDGRDSIFYRINGTEYAIKDSIGLTSGTGWALAGNAGTTPGTHYFGTSDNQEVVIKTNAIERGRFGTDYNIRYGLNNTASGTYSASIGGGSNINSSASAGIFAGAGNAANTGSYQFIGGGYQNQATANYAAITGGNGGKTSGTHTFIGGGVDAIIYANYSAIVAGSYDTIFSAGINSLIGAGSLNKISARYNFVSGLGNRGKNYAGTVVGHYNDTTTSGSATTIDANNKLFEVGMGADNSNRANAFTVYQSGKIRMPDYGVGSNTGTATKWAAWDVNGYLIEEDAPTGGGTDNSWDVFEPFYTRGITNLYSFFNSGTGTVFASMTTEPAASSAYNAGYGWALFNTGTTTTGYTGMRYSTANSTAFRSGNSNTITFQYDNVVFEDLSDGTDTYRARLGTAVYVTNNEPSSGIFFSYTSTDSSGHFVCNVGTSSTYTRFDSGIAVAADTPYDLKYTVTSGTVEFFINDVSVGSTSSNFPDGVAMNPFIIQMVKSAGTTDRSMFVDNFKMKVR